MRMGSGEPEADGLGSGSSRLLGSGSGAWEGPTATGGGSTKISSGRLPRDLGRVAAVRLRNQDDEQQDERDRQDVATSRGAGRAGFQMLDGDRQQTPHEEQHLHREESPDHLGRRGGSATSRGCRAWSEQGSEAPMSKHDDDRGSGRLPLALVGRRRRWPRPGISASRTAGT